MRFRPGLDAFGGLAAGAPRPPDPGFHPALEALEERRTPAMFYWKGGGSASDPASWWNNAVPQAGDDVIFWYVGYSADCPDFAGPPDGGYYHSVTLIGGPSGYPGTVTLAGPLFTESLDVESGTIDQPDDGDDITVGPQSAGEPGYFTWTGGATINGTSHLANVLIQGAVTATIDPQGGTLTTGSNFDFEGTDDEDAADGTIDPGTLVFANASGITVGAFSNLTGAGTDAAPVTLDKVSDGSQFNVKSSSGLVDTGTINSNLPLKNNGGTVRVLNSSTASFAGRVDQLQANGSIQQLSGWIIVENASTLAAVNGMAVNGGRLSTKAISLTAPPPGQPDYIKFATIQGNLTVSGGYVVIDDDAAFSFPRGWSSRTSSGPWRLRVTYPGPAGSTTPLLTGVRPIGPICGPVAGRSTSRRTGHRLARRLSTSRTGVSPRIRTGPSFTGTRASNWQIVPCRFR